MLIIRFFFYSTLLMNVQSLFAQSKKHPKRTIITGQMQKLKAPKKESSVIMSDPLMQKKWDMRQIKAKDAWLKFSTGSRDIVVAVIDTGIDTQHPDLKANIWKNPKEIPGNNIDDDKNGFVDDINGWNFVNNNNDVSDSHGHGTHIAGLIGAEGGNGKGLSGAAPKVSLMALKYFTPSDSGSDNLNNTIKAIDYAVKNGAHIINYSGGGIKGNEKEKQAIKRAEEKGVLFVAASGNEASNIDHSERYYPASYDLQNILSITATDPSDTVLNSSNWGKTVHTSAPGIDILSCLPGGRYGRMTGTSQATAIAAGLAVLVMDYYKIRSARFVINQLKNTGDLKSSLKGKTRFSQRLNIARALAMRGSRVNAWDQMVRGASILHNEEKHRAEKIKEPLEKDINELNLLHIGKSLMGKKDSNKNNAGRNPASSQDKNKSSILPRWLLP